MKRAGLSELQAVVTLSTHRSFRAAASELGMSASALSHAISALEGRMGVRLFHRTTSSVSLSEAGEQFLGRLRPALREIDEAMEAVNAFRDTPQGSLRINASEGAARQIFAPVVLRFLEQFPAMKVDLVTEGRLVDIVAEGFDAGIRLAETVPKDMIAVPFGPPQRFAVVGSPAYFKRHPRPRTPADLAANPCIRMRLPSGAPARWQFEKNGDEQLVDVAGVLTLGSSELRVQAALAGVGLAYVIDWEVADHLASGRLVRVLQDWTPAFPGLALYYPGHRHVAAGLRAFVQVLRACSPASA